MRVDLPRVGAERAGAARDDHADVALGAVVRLHRGLDRGREFVARQRDVNAERFAAAKSKPEVVGRAEELAAEDAEGFPHAVAVEEPVVERADLGVGLVDEVAVDPDEVTCRQS